MILHIANYYTGSKVYMNLVAKLDDLFVPQIVYTAFRGEDLKQNYVEFNTTSSTIIYRPVLGLYSRLHFRYKANLITRDIIENVSLAGIKMIHAHTWYSDGSPAYNL